MKYKLGEEVSVEFIGKISEVTLLGNEIRYKVDSDQGIAILIPETQIYPLPTPENMPENMRGDNGQ